MKIKTETINGVEYAVLKDGKPVYVHSDGKEVEFDAPGTIATISRLNGEAKSHRERAEKAETTLKGFEGIEDPAEALKALKTVKNFDAKKFVDAGEVEKIKSEAIKAVEDKYAPVLKERDTLQAQIATEKITNAFAGSKFIKEKAAIPADFMQARFGHHSKIEEGKLVWYDQNGSKIFSRTRPGDPADTDEALELLVESHSQRDHILKSSGASGGGAQGSGGASGGKRTLSRTQFDSLPADQKAAMATDPKVAIVDG